MAGEYFPPVGFIFVVGFNSSNSNPDGKFQKVSGISFEIVTDLVAEGSESRFKHRLPTPGKPSNLVLKRGVLTVKSDLAIWKNETLSSGLQEPIKTKTIYVSLPGAEGKFLMQWEFINAWPGKGQFSNPDSMKNEILIEFIEFAYSSFKVNHFS